MKFTRKLLTVLIAVLIITFSLAAVPQKKKADKKSKAATKTVATESEFVSVDTLVRQEITNQGITGAVLLVGHNGKIVHQAAFGLRGAGPHPEPMTVDTIFDLASLTKVVATTPSVMRLVQLGQVRINDPVAHYIPEFAANGKQSITVRNLLTHYSGLRPDLDLNIPWQGQDEAFRRASAERPQAPPGAQFVYSDINFIVLGELVQRVSGMGLEKYADAHIFQPLGMKHTAFLPPAQWQSKIAATLAIDNLRVLRGFVHDPTAERMGGVAGHA